MQREAVGLFDLHRAIKGVIKRGVPPSIWVIAEIVDVKINRSGHCYLELSEKGEDKREKARAKGTIWSSRYAVIQRKFKSVTGSDIAIGMRIMVNVSIEFHELYSYSLNILDVEPNFTLGDIARRREEIISRLKKEGLFEQNSYLTLPLVIQNIAVVSSATAAGYQDFVSQLQRGNSYQFTIELFEAVMQGDGCEASVCKALERVGESDEYDAVLIIRGGGSVADLASFDSYNIAKTVALYPIPIITGIGHDKDTTIVDMVSHTMMKTPTAAADFIVSLAHSFHQELISCSNQLQRVTTALIEMKKREIDRELRRVVPMVLGRLQSEGERIANAKRELEIGVQGLLHKESICQERVESRLRESVYRRLDDEKLELRVLYERAKSGATLVIERQKPHIEFLKTRIRLLDPITILQRGYTLTTRNGVIVKSGAELVDGDVITTAFHDREVVSTVNKI